MDNMAEDPVRIFTKENIPISKNSSLYYENKLEIDPKQWEGKRILDLGAGIGGTFEADLKKRHIKADVVSLSLHFGDKKHTILPAHLNGEKTTMITGTALALPFKDGSFDLIVSFMAIPTYLNSFSEFMTVANEIGRVLKEGGIAKFWPLYKAGTGGEYWTRNDLQIISRNSGLKMKIRNPIADLGREETINNDAILVFQK